jgi:hypothetical protein
VRSKETERGLLSVAFYPGYKENGRFFVDYTDLDGNTVVSEFRTSKNPDRSNPSSERILPKINQPASNHNGEQLQFGQDGYLYIGTGDGGFAEDPSGNVQNRSTLLGKLLRIDVDGGSPYRIPADNLYKGAAGARHEVWEYGFRNAWLFSFDSKTGDLYIADIGQSKWEMINSGPGTAREGRITAGSFLKAFTISSSLPATIRVISPSPWSSTAIRKGAPSQADTCTGVKSIGPWTARTLCRLLLGEALGAQKKARRFMGVG